MELIFICMFSFPSFEGWSDIRTMRQEKCRRFFGDGPISQRQKHKLTVSGAIEMREMEPHDFENLDREDNLRRRR